MHRRLALVPFAVLVAVGCGDASQAQEVAELNARIEVQTREIHALEDRFDRSEARARDFEERLAALQTATERAPAAASAEVVAEAGEDAAEDVDPTTAAEVADALETRLAKEKIEAVLAEVEAKKRAEEDERRAERMTQMISDRVRGDLTEQLQLNPVQQDAMIDILTNAATRAGSFWREARDSGDPQAFQTARQKSEELMETVRTDIQGALTTNQFEKLEEITGGSSMGLMFGGRGMRGGRTGGGGR